MFKKNEKSTVYLIVFLINKNEQIIIFYFNIVFFFDWSNPGLSSIK